MGNARSKIVAWGVIICLEHAVLDLSKRLRQVVIMRLNATRQPDKGGMDVAATPRRPSEPSTPVPSQSSPIYPLAPVLKPAEKPHALERPQIVRPLAKPNATPPLAANPSQLLSVLDTGELNVALDLKAGPVGLAKVRQDTAVNLRVRMRGGKLSFGKTSSGQPRTGVTLSQEGQPTSLDGPLFFDVGGAYVDDQGRIRLKIGGLGAVDITERVLGRGVRKVPRDPAQLLDLLQGQAKRFHATSQHPDASATLPSTEDLVRWDSLQYNFKGKLRPVAEIALGPGAQVALTGSPATLEITGSKDTTRVVLAHLPVRNLTIEAQGARIEAEGGLSRPTLVGTYRRRKSGDAVDWALTGELRDVGLTVPAGDRQHALYVNRVRIKDAEGGIRFRTDPDGTAHIESTANLEMRGITGHLALKDARGRPGTLSIARKSALPVAADLALTLDTERGLSELELRPRDEIAATISDDFSLLAGTVPGSVDAELVVDRTSMYLSPGTYRVRNEGTDWSVHVKPDRPLTSFAHLRKLRLDEIQVGAKAEVAERTSSETSRGAAAFTLGEVRLDSRQPPAVDIPYLEVETGTLLHPLTLRDLDSLLASATFAPGTSVSLRGAVQWCPELDGDLTLNFEAPAVEVEAQAPGTGEAQVPPVQVEGRSGPIRALIRAKLSPDSISTRGQLNLEALQLAARSGQTESPPSLANFRLMQPVALSELPSFKSKDWTFEALRNALPIQAPTVTPKLNLELDAALGGLAQGGIDVDFTVDRLDAVHLSSFYFKEEIGPFKFNKYEFGPFEIKTQTGQTLISREPGAGRLSLKVERDPARPEKGRITGGTLDFGSTPLEIRAGSNGLPFKPRSVPLQVKKLEIVVDPKTGKARLVPDVQVPQVNLHRRIPFRKRLEAQLDNAERELERRLGGALGKAWLGQAEFDANPVTVLRLLEMRRKHPPKNPVNRLNEAGFSQLAAAIHPKKVNLTDVVWRLPLGDGQHLTIEPGSRVTLVGTAEDFVIQGEVTLSDSCVAVGDGADRSILKLRQGTASLKARMVTNAAGVRTTELRLDGLQAQGVSLTRPDAALQPELLDASVADGRVRIKTEPPPWSEVALKGVSGSLKMGGGGRLGEMAISGQLESRVEGATFTLQGHNWKAKVPGLNLQGQDVIAAALGEYETRGLRLETLDLHGDAELSLQNSRLHVVPLDEKGPALVVKTKAALSDGSYVSIKKAQVSKVTLNLAGDEEALLQLHGLAGQMGPSALRLPLTRTQEALVGLREAVLETGALVMGPGFVRTVAPLRFSKVDLSVKAADDHRGVVIGGPHGGLTLRQLDIVGPARVSLNTLRGSESFRVTNDSDMPLSAQGVLQGLRFKNPKPPLDLKLRELEARVGRVRSLRLDAFGATLDVDDFEVEGELGPNRLPSLALRALGLDGVNAERGTLRLDLQRLRLSSEGVTARGRAEVQSWVDGEPAPGVKRGATELGKVSGQTSFAINGDAFSIKSTIDFPGDGWTLEGGFDTLR